MKTLIKKFINSNEQNIFLFLLCLKTKLNLKIIVKKSSASNLKWNITNNNGKRYTILDENFNNKDIGKNLMIAKISRKNDPNTFYYLRSCYYLMLSYLMLLDDYDDISGHQTIRRVKSAYTTRNPLRKKNHEMNVHLPGDQAVNTMKFFNFIFSG